MMFHAAGVPSWIQRDQSSRSAPGRIDSADGMPARGLQHVDLCVRDVRRSLACYMDVLGPLGLEEDIRVPSYRGSEEVVYLRFGEQNFWTMKER